LFREYSFPRGIQRQPNNAMRFKVYVYKATFFSNTTSIKCSIVIIISRNRGPSDEPRFRDIIIFMMDHFIDVIYEKKEDVQFDLQRFYLIRFMRLSKKKEI